MPDNFPQDDPVLAPDSPPNTDAVPNPSPDPFFRELAALYDNPEVFFDTSLPLLPRFRVVSPHLANTPTVLTLEISDDLLLALREVLFDMARSTVPDFDKQMMVEYEAKDWDEALSKIRADEEYLQTEREMYWFFIRYFPKLFLRIYDIAARTAVFHAVRYLSDPVEKSTAEDSLKKALNHMLRDLRTDIYRMLGTRKRGGSTAKLKGELRKSLHLEYDSIYALSKTVKKQCDSLRRTFNTSRNRAGLSEWQAFWQESAPKLFPEYDSAFLALFSTADNPSTSDVAYIWISQSTTLSQSYVRKKIKELRKAARMASKQRDIETT
jgi:hypothetical protein